MGERKEYRPPDSLEQEGKDRRKEIIEGGEEKKATIIQQIRKEGEAVVCRLFQTIDRLIERKHHPEWLRKALLEPKEPVTDLGSYRKARQEQMPTLGPMLEMVYGSLSFGARKIIESVLKGTTEFGGKLGDLSARASKRFADARRLYGIKEDKETEGDE